MTRGGMKEYLDAIRPRYRSAGRREKGRILDEAVRVTGQHRKALIRSLRSQPAVVSQSKAGRPKRYGLEAATTLKVLWEASDRICAKRLQPFLPELLAVLERHGELLLEWEVKDQVCTMSAATIDRLLRPHRQPELRRPFSTTKPGSPAQGLHPYPHLHRMERTPTRLPGNRPGGPLWREHRRPVPQHPSALWTSPPVGWPVARRNGQGPATGGRRHPPHRPEPALPPPGPGLGQRQRVHQPPPLCLLSAEVHHLHPVPGPT